MSVDTNKKSHKRSKVVGEDNEMFSNFTVHTFM